MDLVYCAKCGSKLSWRVKYKRHMYNQMTGELISWVYEKQYCPNGKGFLGMFAHHNYSCGRNRFSDGKVEEHTECYM